MIGAYRWPWLFLFLGLATLLGWWQDKNVSSGPHSEPPNKVQPLPASDTGKVVDRLYQALHVRLTTRRGDQETLLHGEDGKFKPADLDPFFWHHSNYLLTGAAQRDAIAALDEFLAKGPEQLVRDPLHRALVQRDLWALFDSVAGPVWFKERRALSTRLARAMQRLALTPDQIAGLPDNYAAAVATHAFPARFDEGNPDTSFLPTDLWQPDGPWVLLGHEAGELLTPEHTRFFGGRSNFVVFLRLPKGRAETLNYLCSLNCSTAAHEEIPQVPPGTEIALVRQTLLIDNRGKITPTRLTETVQLRHFRRLQKHQAAGDELRYEFKVRPLDLRAGKVGGLGPIASDNERDFILFMGSNASEGSSAVLASCRQCHGFPGIHGVNSYTRAFSSGGPARLTAANSQRTAELTRRWKHETFTWGLLQGLWEELRD
jgi:hypothetical protein